MLLPEGYASLVSWGACVQRFEYSAYAKSAHSTAFSGVFDAQAVAAAQKTFSHTSCGCGACLFAHLRGMTNFTSGFADFSAVGGWSILSLMMFDSLD